MSMNGICHCNVNAGFFSYNDFGLLCCIQIAKITLKLGICDQCPSRAKKWRQVSDFDSVAYCML